MPSPIMMITLRMPVGFAAGLTGAAAAPFVEVPLSPNAIRPAEDAANDSKAIDANAARTNRQDVRCAEREEQINMTDEARRRARRFKGGKSVV
jgi:hypothetical protein